MDRNALVGLAEFLEVVAESDAITCRFVVDDLEVVVSLSLSASSLPPFLFWSIEAADVDDNVPTVPAFCTFFKSFESLPGPPVLG